MSPTSTEALEPAITHTIAEWGLTPLSGLELDELFGICPRTARARRGDAMALPPGAGADHR
jgi:hypothetical protein